jgi:hypothetical protein
MRLSKGLHQAIEIVILLVFAFIMGWIARSWGSDGEAAIFGALCMIAGLLIIIVREVSR